LRGDSKRKNRVYTVFCTVFCTALIPGDLKFDAGTVSDDFEAIGRGKLNVEGLPLYKDRVGGIGTPTSDNKRTKLTPGTTQLLVVINGYSGENGLMETANHCIQLLGKYAALGKHKVSVVKQTRYTLLKLNLERKRLDTEICFGIERKVFK